MRILFFDCFSGVAGDMCVAALRDLGVPESVFLEALEALSLPKALDVHFSRGMRQGIAGFRFEVGAGKKAGIFLKPAARAGLLQTKTHEHGRNHREIRELLEAAPLADELKRRALAVFQRIAIAEGKIHGVSADEVGFHEVGAEDSIADIVAACAGIAHLAPDKIQCSRLVEGSGFVTCAHGQFPLPAPATLGILEGIPLRQIDENNELITPTGAALVAEFAAGFGPMPEMSVQRIGYGLGTRDTAPRPNVLRVVLGEASPTGSDDVVVMEANIDDLTPELLAAAAESLRSAGALEVYMTPVHMKKGRSGTLLSVLAPEAMVTRLSDIMLTETGTFGVRMHTVHRRILERTMTRIETPMGAIAIKLGKRDGKVLHAVPEYEACRTLARAHGVPVLEVYRMAMAECANL